MIVIAVGNVRKNYLFMTYDKAHLLTDESVVDGVAQIRKFQQDREIYVD